MIYVEPSRPGKPPTALIVVPSGATEVEEGIIVAEIMQARVSYSNDNGAWLWEDGTIVDPELGNAITEHARNLGVEAFQ